MLKNKGGFVMAMDSKYRLLEERTHCRWDNSIVPLVTVEPGDVVELETKEASDRQIAPGSSVDVLANLDFSVIHPLTGPVAVVGCEPCCLLVGEVRDILAYKRRWPWTTP